MVFDVHFHVIQPLGCKMNFLNKPNMNMKKERQALIDNSVYIT